MIHNFPQYTIAVVNMLLSQYFFLCRCTFHCGVKVSGCSRLELGLDCVGCSPDTVYQWAVTGSMVLDDTTTFGTTDKYLAIKVHSLHDGGEFIFKVTGGRFFIHLVPVDFTEGGRGAEAWRKTLQDFILFCGHLAQCPKLYGPRFIFWGKSCILCTSLPLPVVASSPSSLY